MSDIVRFSNDLVNLCLLRDDIESMNEYVRWLSSPDISDYVDFHYDILTINDIRNFFNDEDCESLSIVDKDSGDLIGFCCIKKFCSNIISFSIRYLVIGDKQYRNRGYGKSVLNILLNFLFNDCNARRVELGVVSNNFIARKVYSVVGFKEVGRRREAHYCNGEYSDIIMMDITRTDYDNING